MSKRNSDGWKCVELCICAVGDYCWDKNDRDDGCDHLDYIGVLGYKCKAFARSLIVEDDGRIERCDSCKTLEKRLFEERDNDWVRAEKGLTQDD